MSEIFMSNITNSYDITRSCDRHKVTKNKQIRNLKGGHLLICVYIPKIGVEDSRLKTKLQLTIYFCNISQVALPFI